MAIIDGDVLKFLETEENKTRQRKTQTDVAFVMTFRRLIAENKNRIEAANFSGFMFLTQ